MNWVEYVRRDTEGSDSDTRRRAASELFKTLTDRFPQQARAAAQVAAVARRAGSMAAHPLTRVLHAQMPACSLAPSPPPKSTQVTELFTGYVGAMLQEHARSPAANWKAKDCAIYLVTALTVRGKTAAAGATTTNTLVNLQARAHAGGRRRAGGGPQASGLSCQAAGMCPPLPDPRPSASLPHAPPAGLFRAADCARAAGRRRRGRPAHPAGRRPQVCDHLPQPAAQGRRARPVPCPHQVRCACREAVPLCVHRCHPHSAPYTPPCPDPGPSATPCSSPCPSGC